MSKKVQHVYIVINHDSETPVQGVYATREMAESKRYKLRKEYRLLHSKDSRCISIIRKTVQGMKHIETKGVAGGKYIQGFLEFISPGAKKGVYTYSKAD